MLRTVQLTHRALGKDTSKRLPVSITIENPRHRPIELSDTPSAFGPLWAVHREATLAGGAHVVTPVVDGDPAWSIRPCDPTRPLDPMNRPGCLHLEVPWRILQEIDLRTTPYFHQKLPTDTTSPCCGLSSGRTRTLPTFLGWQSLEPASFLRLTIPPLGDPWMHGVHKSLLSL